MTRSRPPRLDDAALSAALAELPGWRREGDALVRRFEFPDFVAAFGFMARAALCAERAGHHPDWSNSYKRVDVRLTTHEVGGLTARDVDLARAFSELVGRPDA
ncbi:MAG: 4a-hydroxytetrahydrobiopterin dehydratase [Planctomycetota bacterium]